MIIIGSLLIGVITSAVVLKYTLRDWREDHVAGVSIDQDGSSLVFAWNKIHSGKYEIEISCEGHRKAKESITENTYVLDDIEYLKDYKVTVSGMNEDGKMVRGTSETFFTRKPQEIHLSTAKAGGHKDDTIDLKPEADQEVECATADETIASVDEEGVITLAKTGKTKVTLTVPGNDELLPETVEVPVTCFPEKLDTPALTKGKDTGSSVVLKLGRSAYAEEYELLRKNPASGEFEVYKSIGAEEFGDGKTYDITLAKDAGTYCLRAEADAGDERMVSDTSKEVAVEPDLEGADKYSSITVIKEFGSDEVESIVRSSGGGGAGLAQSMCCTGDGYVIAFVNRGNSIGRLEKYDLSGQRVAVNEAAGHLGHANGCTYDPNTGNIYVMKTYASANYNEIRAFDSETLESKDSASFPMSPSGIGYDAQMAEFYMTASSRIYITDKDMGLIRTIYRKRAYRSQDICGYNGIAMSCIWTGGSGSYIDMYREADGSYLGSFLAPFGEIESACVEDGHLVMLFNGGTIYRTKERVDFPG